MLGGNSPTPPGGNLPFCLPVIFNTSLTVTWSSATCWQLKGMEKCWSWLKGGWLKQWKKFVNFVGPVRPLEIKRFGRVHTIFTELALVPCLCWKSSYLVFLKTPNNYWFGVSLSSLSFCWVCSLYVWTKFSRNAGQNSSTMVEIAPNYMASEKENYITYSWDHTDSRAVN